eukprot:14537985-Ditylum_brightwellii.AAC.1
MKKTSIEADTKIIEQGNIGNYLCIIESDNITHLVDSKAVGAAEKCYTFGDFAIMYDCPGAATCIAKTKHDIWHVDQGLFCRIR